jgi:hypothetical protein
MRRSIDRHAAVAVHRPQRPGDERDDDAERLQPDPAVRNRRAQRTGRRVMDVPRRRFVQRGALRRIAAERVRRARRRLVARVRQRQHRRLHEQYERTQDGVERRMRTAHGVLVELTEENARGKTNVLTVRRRLC